MKISKIEERLFTLEQTLPNPKIAGTILSRTLSPDKETKLGWCLAIGHMQMPKTFWYGETIDEVITLAEKELLK